MTEFDRGLENDSSGSDGDTDEELQEAFASGLLKPGLNAEAREKKQVKSNVQALKQKLTGFEKKLPWVERLDLTSGPAPLAPELAYSETTHATDRQQILKQNKSNVTLDQDVVHNDFKREMLFYRQAQATVLAALPRLHDMNIITRRPNDYFAQMVKTDDHMQKIRQKLVTKQMGIERGEKVKKLRELKKFGKKVQVEVQQKRQKEKREMMEDVKKFKKGQTDNLDFLEKRNSKKGEDRVSAKRQAKDKKFGFGGKKRGQKHNTKESASDVSEYRPFKKGGGKKGATGGRRPGGNKSGGNQRPGKSKRQKIKNKKKGGR